MKLFKQMRDRITNISRMNLTDVLMKCLMIAFSSCSSSAHNIDKTPSQSTYTERNIKRTHKTKVLIITYSQYPDKPDTALAHVVAELKSNNIEYDVENIVTNAFHIPLLGDIKISLYTAFNIAVNINQSQYDPVEYGLIIFITPIWSDKIAVPIQCYMNQIESKLPSNAFVSFLIKCNDDSVKTHLACNEFKNKYHTVLATQTTLLLEDDLLTGKDKQKIKIFMKHSIRFVKSQFSAENHSK